MALHKIQQLILQVAEDQDIAKLSLKEIGKEITKLDPSIRKTYPQLIKFHMDQLQRKGLMSLDRSQGVVAKGAPGWAKGILKGAKAKLYNIPVYGMANCGSGGIVAEQNLEGFVQVSNSLLKKRPKDYFFAVIAAGKSMNRASVEGKNIEAGDYLIIDKDAAIDSGDTVLAVLGETGLIKKFVKDEKHQQILLVSESTEQYPPIALHEDDLFGLNGKVVQVIKTPKE